MAPVCLLHTEVQKEKVSGMFKELGSRESKNKWRYDNNVSAMVV